MNDLDQAKQSGIAPWDDIVLELSDTHVSVFRDRYPVTEGHLLFVPKWNTSMIISQAFNQAWLYGRKMVIDGKCDSYNIGMNCGEQAGQTVMYPHIHLIPRQHGDCVDPVGGVRGVIPGQANYKSRQYKHPCHP